MDILQTFNPKKYTSKDQIPEESRRQLEEDITRGLEDYQIHPNIDFYRPIYTSVFMSKSPYNSKTHKDHVIQRITDEVIDDESLITCIKDKCEVEDIDPQVISDLTYEYGYVMNGRQISVTECLLLLLDTPLFTTQLTLDMGNLEITATMKVCNRHVFNTSSQRIQGNSFEVKTTNIPMLTACCIALDKVQNNTSRDLIAYSLLYLFNPELFSKASSISRNVETVMRKCSRGDISLDFNNLECVHLQVYDYRYKFDSRKKSLKNHLLAVYDTNKDSKLISESDDVQFDTVRALIDVLCMSPSKRPTATLIVHSEIQSNVYHQTMLHIIKFIETLHTESGSITNNTFASYSFGAPAWKGKEWYQQHPKCFSKPEDFAFTDFLFIHNIRLNETGRVSESDADEIRKLTSKYTSSIVIMSVIGSNITTFLHKQLHDEDAAVIHINTQLNERYL